MRSLNVGLIVAVAASFSLVLSASSGVQAQSWNYQSVLDLSTPTQISGKVFTDFSTPAFGGDGKIYLRGETNNAGSTATATRVYAYYSYSTATGLSKLVTQGDALPASVGAGATVNTPNSPHLAGPNVDASGNMYFSTSISGVASTVDRGVFKRDATTGAITTIAQRGTTAPDGSTYGIVGSNMNGNDNGKIAFVSSGAAPGIYAYDNALGTTSLVAKTGLAVAPGSSEVFDTFANPYVANNGNISFWGSTTGNPDSTRYIFGYDGSSFTKLVTAGQASSVASFNFSNILAQNYLNSQGTLVFSSGISDGATTRTGLFQRNNNGSFSTIALQGDSTGFGGTFGTITATRINDAGTSIFRSSGTGAGNGIFTFSTATGLNRVISVGDVLFGSTVSSISNPNLSATGQVAIMYTLADGRSGVMSAASSVAVPEPSTLSLLSLIALPGFGVLLSKRKVATDRS